MKPFEVLLAQPFYNFLSLLGVGGRSPFDDGFKGRRSLEDISHPHQCLSLGPLNVNQSEMNLYTFGKDIIYKFNLYLFKTGTLL
jgi:hypothetical protein